MATKVRREFYSFTKSREVIPSKVIASIAMSFMLPWVGITVGFAQAPETAVPWIKDLDEAKLIAAESQKDLFILFTGRGWCSHCEKLHEYLFNTPVFRERLTNQFVPVELDFNFGESKPEQLRLARYRSWEKKYLIQGLPTMVFADRDGNPFLIAQRPREELDRFIERVDAAVAQRTARDVHFAAAESLDGIPRAMKLHDGLDAISKLLSIEGNDSGSLVTHFYPQETLAILAASNPKKEDKENELSRVQEFYRERINGANQTRRKNSILKRVQKLQLDNQYGEAVKILEHQLGLCETTAERLEIQVLLADLYQRVDRPEDALTALETVLKNRFNR